MGKQILTDFQGWPEYARTLREFLLFLGFEEDDKTFTLIKSEENNKLLDAYPRILVDDGMGYGIHQGFIVETDPHIYKYNHDISESNVMKNENVINIFIDQEDNRVKEE